MDGKGRGEDRRGRCEEKKFPGGARESGGQGGGHVIHGAEGYGVEGAGFGHGFYASGPDFDGKAEGADDFAEEGGLFVLGFCESDLNFRVKEGDGEAGKASSAAEVQKG